MCTFYFRHSSLQRTELRNSRTYKHVDTGTLLLLAFTFRSFTLVQYVTAAAATLARSLAPVYAVLGPGAHLLNSLINWPKVHTIGILHQLAVGEQRTTVNFLPTAAAATTTSVSAADDAAATRLALGRRCQTALNDSTYVYVRRSPVRKTA